MKKLIIVMGYEHRKVSDLAYDLRRKYRVSAYYDFKEREPDFAHPEKMVEFARFCAKTTDKTIVMATFSDFFVKEINNCIMAKQAKAHGYTPEMYLDPENVEAYIVERDGTIKQVQVDQYGLLETAFDETIDSINKRGSALADAVPN